MKSNVSSTLKEYLSKNVEGSISETGYVISILEFSNIGMGRILPNGDIAIKIKYKALLLNPQKADVIDAKIVSKNKMGYFAKMGPISAFISIYQIPDHLLEHLSNSMNVRLKIIGTKIEPKKIVVVGTLKGDELGLKNLQ